MKDTIIVLTGIDSHLGRIEKCIGSLKKIYNENLDYGLATFGNSKLKPSVGLESYCKQNGYLFFDDQRQYYLTSSEFHACEIIGLISISKHYYDMGYNNVFILHNDMIIFKDFIPLYRSRMNGNWSFIVPFTNIDVGFGTEREYSYARSKNIDQIKQSPYRMPQTIVIFNKKLINDIYCKYDSNRTLWNRIFCNISMYGDIGLISIADNLMGYNASPILEEIEASLRWCNKEKVIEKIKANEIYYIHGEDTCGFL